MLFEEIERSQRLVDKLILMPRQEASFRREISISRAVATTRIEGATLGEDAVRGLARGLSKAGLTEDELANVGALRAYEFIDYLSDSADQPINELVVREINRNVLFGASEIVMPGTYRNGQNTVGDRFTPPNQGDVPDLMRSFAQWLSADDPTTHPVVRAALAHIHLVAIHPFWDGNGRTARGLATLIMQRSPFHFRKLLSVESVLLELRDEYFTAIERTLGRTFTDDYGATPFVEFFVRAVSLDTAKLVQRMTDWHDLIDNVQRSLTREGIRQRQIDGVLHTIQAGRLTRGEYIEMTKVSPVTASRDLADLVARGILRAEGETRNRVYFWASRTKTEAQDPPSERG